MSGLLEPPARLAVASEDLARHVAALDARDAAVRCNPKAARGTLCDGPTEFLNLCNRGCSNPKASVSLSMFGATNRAEVRGTVTPYGSEVRTIKRVSGWEPWYAGFIGPSVRLPGYCVYGYKGTAQYQKCIRRPVRKSASAGMHLPNTASAPEMRRVKVKSSQVESSQAMSSRPLRACTCQTRQVRCIS